MKQIIKNSLVVCLAVIIGQTVSAYDFEANGIYYNMVANYSNVVEVTYCTEDEATESYTGSIVIPATVTHNGTVCRVERIGKSAFKNCTGLTSISIPSNTETIADYAFEYCSSLTTVTLSKGLETIGKYVFYKCNSLKSITLPSSVKELGANVFTLCI